MNLDKKSKNMKQKYQTILDDEIDLKAIALTLWGEKYLILIISLIFSVAAYMYVASKPKFYETTVIIRNSPEYLFQKFKPLANLQNPNAWQQGQVVSYAEDFNKEFKLLILSPDNLVNFVKQNEKLSEFKSYLKTNKIETSDYFRGKLQFVSSIKNRPLDQYKLNFYKPLSGEEFLNDYIVFSYKLTQDIFKKKILQYIFYEIEIFNHHLEIAKKINLENPIIKNSTEGNSVVNEPVALFYKGTKVLSQQKLYLEKVLTNVQNFNLNFNPIFQKASYSILVTKQPFVIASVAFVLGLLFSVIVLFFRSIILR